MTLVDILLLAVGLAMDAFAVSICKGLAMRKIEMKSVLIIGLWFGGFQALMPFLGWLLGSRFSAYITAVDHWIAFGLLVLIGANMIREALGKDEEEQNASVGIKEMLPLAVATSIDALAVGISFACSNPNVIADAGELTNVLISVIIIGVITAIISGIGVKIGNVFGTSYKSKAEIVGGVVLILIGVKILLQDLGLLTFLG